MSYSFTQWKQHQPLLMQQVLLGYSVNNHCDIRSIESLGNGRFASAIFELHSNEFKVLIFECAVNSLTQKFEIQINHIITPAPQCKTMSSEPSGTIVALTNGHLLTYHKHHDGLQIWDSHNGTCLKSWNWRDLHPNQNFASFIKIIPFPDYRHLLIHQEDSLFIFNRNQLTLKQIKINNLNFFGSHHLLPDGKLLIFHKHNKDAEFLKISHFAIPQTHALRRKINAFFDMEVTMYCYLFKHLNLPTEICLHILSYAFSPEAQHHFIANDNEASQKRCSIM